jgi:hypothetical protein
MDGEGRLDLALFDAEAEDLHLEVVAAQELDGAVRQPAAQVSGPVPARAHLACDAILQEALRVSSGWSR